MPYTPYQKKALKKAYLTDPLLTKTSAISIDIFYEGLHMAAFSGRQAVAGVKEYRSLEFARHWLKIAGPARHFKLLKLRKLP
jgi:hypothetical protein